MRLSAVMCVVDSWLVVEESLSYLIANSDSTTRVILLDNGSYEQPPAGLLEPYAGQYTLHRFEDNRGGNSVFHRMLPYLADAEFVAYMHNDVAIREDGWGSRICAAFDRDPLLACVGLVGSNEIDGLGGRGLGTRSSFMGYDYRTMWASKAEVHGRRSIGVEAAAVLDHALMAFRVDMLKQLPAQDANDYHTPGHFYDRVLCCEMISRGWHIATIGIECDHASGGIGSCKTDVSEQVGLRNRDDFYKKWLGERGIVYDPERLDQAIYEESERRYLGKWRERFKFIPFKVMSDYTVIHGNSQWKNPHPLSAIASLAVDLDL